MQGKEANPLLQVQWSGPGFSEQALEPENLFHLNGESKAEF
jgi:hypothetical protein